MYKVCVFAGTKEGREISEYLVKNGIETFASVTTEYGEELLTESDNLTVSVKKLPRPEMVELFEKEKFDLVIDATHPYAESITESIIDSCRKTGIERVRLLRKESEKKDDVIYVENREEALKELEKTEGNILLTTGSKDLSFYSALPGFKDRVYARVLPSGDSLNLALDAGLPSSHIIAMQGPFSKEMNCALLEMTAAKVLLTKDGGSNGGFEEKIEAAKEKKVKAVVIGRPVEKGGLSFDEVKDFLKKKFDIKEKKHVSVIGIGPGDTDYLTEKGKKEIQAAQCIIGARRMTEGAAGKAVFYAISPKDIANIIETTDCEKYAVLMSGDSGFFSGTKKLFPLLSECDTEVVPGISSFSYFASKIGVSYDNAKMISTHGRDISIVNAVRNNHKVFSLSGGRDGINQMLQDLLDNGLSDVKVFVGENLSYENEKISEGKAKDLLDKEFSSLSVIFIENEHLSYVTTSGLPDSCFTRSEGVPMTKSEVRAIALSKLVLHKDSIVWDVGAGTGSVTIEAALKSPEGKVYAIEKKDNALFVLNENVKNFRVSNVIPVSGSAPEVLGSLEAPTHVFIGGSSGNMREIIDIALKKNPDARIVATAVTLETVAELTAVMKDFPLSEVVSVSVSSGKELGKYHLMSAQNPIYVFTMCRRGEVGCTL